MTKREALDLSNAVSKLKAMAQPAESSPKTPPDATDEPPNLAAKAAEPPVKEEPKESREEGAEQEADELTLDAEQFAELIGIEADRVFTNEKGEVRFKTKADGEEGDATLNELLERYQRDANLTNRSKELAKLKKQYEDNIHTLFTQSQQYGQQVQSMIHTMEKAILQENQKIDWNELRQEDPAEYAARKAEMEERKHYVQELKKQATNELTKAQQEQQQHLIKVYQEYAEREQKALMKALPEWSETTKKDLAGYLSSLGYQSEEINSLIDHRAIVIAHKAMLYDKGTKEVPVKLSKRPLPKVLKPGVKLSKDAVKAEQEQALRAQLKKSGSIDDAAAIFRNFATQKR